jgi:hypothetical protein
MFLRYDENPKLGTWVGTQRKHYRLYMTGKKSIVKIIQGFGKFRF